ELSIYTPPAILDPDATWYWRVRAVDARGEASPPTHTRAFRIAPDAVPFPLPPLEEVRARIPTAHPRLFVRPESVAALREKDRTDPLFRVLGDQIERRARALLTATLPDEPPHASPGGVWDVNLWREYRITVRATDDMETLAFAYLLTGDPEFAAAARRWMLHIAAWDPRGATSAAVNDESSMPILYKMSRAYTWIYDALSPADRQTIREVMRIRGNEAYEILKRRPFESRPYGSHAGRSLGFLGEAAIAFLGEIPEAADWFDYVVRIFFAVYPAWGKEPGGWAEGHAYWTSYMNRVIWFVDALKVATGLDLYQKPFFRNTGMFKLYTQPPYSKMGPFGDFADRGPTAGDGNVMAHFAAVYRDPYYKWYADQLAAAIESGVMGYLRAALYERRGLAGKAPLDLPSSAYFPDIGWVVFHKRLGEARDSIQFMFKSSPYGSFSHSLADQNTFTLEAYGSPLAISSGYRPWYGSKHHMGWTKTTQAHNGILVDGVGQIVQSLSAKGQITGFLHGQSFDYTAGEAAQAYGGRLERFTRHVVYIRPDVFVLFDDLRALAPSTYQWLLHAYHPMTIDPAAGRIHLDGGEAELDVHLWSSQPLAYSQTDQFAVPLDEPLDKPVQWHLQASTRSEAEAAYFAAVLVPAKAGSPRPVRVEPIDAEAGEGLRLLDGAGETTLLFRTGEGRLAAGGLEIEGNVGGRRRWGDAAPGAVGVLLVDGTAWRTAEGWALTSSVPIDVELTVRTA
ncbi:MAG TPA: DUF4962 domain-containing protein, partial [Limnochordia bacterium]